MLFVLPPGIFNFLTNSISPCITYQKYCLFNQTCFQFCHAVCWSRVCMLFFRASHTLLQFICPLLQFTSLIIVILRAIILLIDSFYMSCSLFHLCLCINFITGITWSMQFPLFSPLGASCFMTVNDGYLTL